MPELEVEYQNFLSKQEAIEEETLDPDWQIENHPALEIINQYHPNFKNWVSTMTYFLSLQYAGYPFEKNEFSLMEWQVLGVLKRFKKDTELNAIFGVTEE